MAATHFKGPVISPGGFVGPVTGAITGNITGNLTGNVTGNLSGNQSGGSVSATTLSASTSLSVGASPATIKKIGSGSVSVDAGTLAAQTALDVSLNIPGVAAGDIVQLMPANASMEAGLAIAAVWISAADTVKVRLFNNNAAAALVGGAQNWTYLWTDLT